MLSTRLAGLTPYTSAESTQAEFDNLLGRLFGGSDVPTGRLTPYGVDVREDGDHVVVEAELPGFSKEDVDITLENSTLTFIAEHKQQRPEGDGEKTQWLLRERHFGRVQRSFRLPRTVNEQSVKAILADGVLTITLDKREETKPRKVQVL